MTQRCDVAVHIGRSVRQFVTRDDRIARTEQAGVLNATTPVYGQIVRDRAIDACQCAVGVVSDPAAAPLNRVARNRAAGEGHQALIVQNAATIFFGRIAADRAQVDLDNATTVADPTAGILSTVAGNSRLEQIERRLVVLDAPAKVLRHVVSNGAGRNRQDAVGKIEHGTAVVVGLVVRECTVDDLNVTSLIGQPAPVDLREVPRQRALAHID